MHKAKLVTESTYNLQLSVRGWSVCLHDVHGRRYGSWFGCCDKWDTDGGGGGRFVLIWRNEEEMKVMASLEMTMKMKTVLCFAFSTSLHLSISLQNLFVLISFSPPKLLLFCCMCVCIFIGFKDESMLLLDNDMIWINNFMNGILTFCVFLWFFCGY